MDYCTSEITKVVENRKMPDEYIVFYSEQIAKTEQFDKRIAELAFRERNQEKNPAVTVLAAWE